MLGNIVAVTSIIAVVSLIQGMNAYVSDAIITDVGADNFTIQRMPVVRTVEDEERVRNNPRITLRDADAVRRFSDNIHAVAAQANASGRIACAARSRSTGPIQGVSRDYLYFSTFDVERGRLISPTEIDRNRPVTVLGWEVADKLFGGRDPLDKTIKISGVHFRVVGVSEKKGSIFGQSQDSSRSSRSARSARCSARVRPAAAGQAAHAGTGAAGDGRRDGGDADRAAAAAEGAGQLRHVHVRHAARPLPTATAGMFAVLIGVVALSLVVGGIVIMNIMLMVVSERTREIGLRKALGARRRDIIWRDPHRVGDAVDDGRVVGIGLGFIAALIVSKLTPLPAAVQVWSVGMGIGITAVVGLFFGLYPAMRAARLDPIDALRRSRRWRHCAAACSARSWRCPSTRCAPARCDRR